MKEHKLGEPAKACPCCGAERFWVCSIDEQTAKRKWRMIAVSAQPISDARLMYEYWRKEVERLAEMRAKPLANAQIALDEQAGTIEQVGFS